MPPCGASHEKSTLVGRSAVLHADFKRATTCNGRQTPSEVFFSHLETEIVEREIPLVLHLCIDDFTIPHHDAVHLFSRQGKAKKKQRKPRGSGESPLSPRTSRGNIGKEVADSGPMF